MSTPPKTEMIDQRALARMFANEDGRWDMSRFHHSLYVLMATYDEDYNNGT
jgi:hypothetical protein